MNHLIRPQIASSCLASSDCLAYVVRSLDKGVEGVSICNMAHESINTTCTGLFPLLRRTEHSPIWFWLSSFASGEKCQCEDEVRCRLERPGSSLLAAFQTRDRDRSTCAEVR